MDKRERTVRLKEIINALSELVVTLNDQVTPLMDEVEKRLSSLAELLEANFIVPSDFDESELYQSILSECLEYHEDLKDVISMIEEFRDEVHDVIDEMNDGTRRDEWTEFYDQLDGVEQTLSFSDSGAETMDDVIQNIKDLQENLSDLV
jgi:uncharacterized coiled-coil DUF342 family protein